MVKLSETENERKGSTGRNGKKVATTASKQATTGEEKAFKAFAISFNIHLSWDQ